MRIYKKMKKVKLLFVCFIVFSFGSTSIASVLSNAKSIKIPKVESIIDPEIQSNLLIDKKVSNIKTSSLSLPLIQKEVSSPEVNLLLNGSLEDANISNTPTNWSKGGYGTNTRTFTYPVTGYNGGKAIKVQMTSYTSGDAKWYFADVPVTAGDTYTFSDYYLSDIPSVVDARFTMSDGSYKYVDLLYLDPILGGEFKKATTDIIIPDNVVSITFFHLINNVGYLITDNYSLSKSTLPPPSQNNLILNPNFEQTDSFGFPAFWKKGGWGNNVRNFIYPSDIGNGNKSITVNITKYTSGDAKWYFNPISIPSGIYSYSENYISDENSFITAQFQNSDNSYSYKDLLKLPPVTSMSQTSVDFFVPVGTKNVTIFHLIDGIGYLSLDNVALYPKSESRGIFTTGAVAFRFDDGWLSQYTNAASKLSSSGLNGTFYISSRQLLENGFSGFMDHSQLKDLYARGFEIGAHTKSHAHLTQLTPEEQLDEIQNSRNDLIAMGLGQVNSFSYPYGEYNETTMQIVKDVGFSSAVSVVNGYAMPFSDKYQLERKEIVTSTTLDEIKEMVDEASRDKKWLIFEMHEVNNSGNFYSTTEDVFNQAVDYVVQKQIPVVTISQGIQSI
jgi:peptidoglycan/xylan/chitin deacetylase (PgdA/CDA1 family)